MRVFIGSSAEKEQKMDEIAAMAGGSGHATMRWTDPASFPAGVITLNRLLQLTNLVDAAVFIFSEDDAAWYRGENTPQTRDNVIFEYGLFLGKLGEGHAIIVRIGNPRHPTDLAGLNVIPCPTGNLRDIESKFTYWINGLVPHPQPPGGAENLADERSIFRLLQVISFLDLKRIRPTTGRIFHLLSEEDRILEAMLVLAIQRQLVRAEPDSSGLMVYHLTPQGEELLGVHT